MCVPGVARSVTDDGSLTQFAGCLRPHSLLRKEKNMFAKLNLYSLTITENMLLFAGGEIFTWSSTKWAYLWKKFWEEKKSFTEKCYRDIFQEIWQGNTWWSFCLIKIGIYADEEFIVCT